MANAIGVNTSQCTSYHEAYKIIKAQRPGLRLPRLRTAFFMYTKMGLAWTNIAALDHDEAEQRRMIWEVRGSVHPAGGPPAAVPHVPMHAASNTQATGSTTTAQHSPAARGNT